MEKKETQYMATNIAHEQKKISRAIGISWNSVLWSMTTTRNIIPILVKTAKLFITYEKNTAIHTEMKK